MSCLSIVSSRMRDIIIQESRQTLRVAGLPHQTCSGHIAYHLTHGIPVVDNHRQTCCHGFDKSYAESVVVGRINESVNILQYGRYIGSATKETNIVQAMSLAETDAVVIAPRFCLVASANKIEVEIRDALLMQELNAPTDDTL